MRIVLGFSFLVLVAVSAACSPRAATPAPPPAALEQAETDPSAAADTALPILADALAGPGDETSEVVGESACAADAEPSFSFGFAALKHALGARMGEPLTCERTSVATGDSLQQTTRGLARYVKRTNTPTFTSGVEHWALTNSGIVYWIGRSPQPPDDAGPGLGPTAAESAPLAPVAATPVPLDTAMPTITIEPAWLRGALELLAAYDRRHGTILEKTIETTKIVVADTPGAWAAYIPKQHTITLDSQLRDESPEALSAVLAHEGQHAVDTRLNGKQKNRADPEVQCYSWEISAFSLEAAVWQSVYGDAGKADPRTQLERELNDILRSAKTDSWQLMARIRDRYRDQCV